MEEDPGSLGSFLKWAATLGISDSTDQFQSGSRSCLGSSLLVSYFPDAGGRGLAAARELGRGELILRVPKSALMTSECLLKDQKLASSVNRYPHLSPTQILIVCLLAEMGKGKDSWWYPYLMQLPRSYDTLASFTCLETQALQVDEAIWATEKATSKAELDWKEALPLMKDLELRQQLLTFRSWLWASATVSSRTMHIPWDDAGCLCPVGDFFNYAAPGEESLPSEVEESWRQSSSSQVCSSLNDGTTEKSETDVFDIHSQRLTDAEYRDDIAAYCFYAREKYKKGEQVLLSYGTYTNLELLEYYGFILNANPNDKAFIHLEADIHSSSSWPKDSLYIQQDGKPSFALLSTLRLWATPPNQRRSLGHLAYSGSQLSVDNEISIMRWMRNNCRVLLENLPTAVEEDVLLLHVIVKLQDDPAAKEIEQMLSTSGDDVRAFFKAFGLLKESNVIPLSRKARRSMGRWKLAVQWRLRYKNILVNCVSCCNEAINFLSSQNLSSNRTMLPSFDNNYIF
ncbi:protein SET DOMAIN GROUP 40 [Macadamia integrifolia]|uniref:protein SET DOMAIN GROUP 40 n=1 Tax=Macadamia integrifolia TaxID=60698 RepID=UPI001C4FD4CA|nr:protein SET DOMAIN GROUP 40 [Macadamia integrifolia]